MSNNVNSNQKVADENSSNTNSAASQAESSSSNQTVLKKQSPPKYAIINPTSGEMVQPSNPNYETYKAELGGDAGTVPLDKSETCHKAKLKILTASK